MSAATVFNVLWFGGLLVLPWPLQRVLLRALEPDGEVGPVDQVIAAAMALVLAFFSFVVVPAALLFGASWALWRFLGWRPGGWAGAGDRPRGIGPGAERLP